MTPHPCPTLLPCPFCGASALLENESFDPTEAWCSCPNSECILWGEVHDPIKWNTRADLNNGVREKLEKIQEGFDIQSMRSYATEALALLAGENNG